MVFADRAVATVEGGAEPPHSKRGDRVAFAELRDVRIHYELVGPANAPVVMFSNSLGTNFSMWDAQASEVTKTFRVLRYDKRGHGRSSVPPTPYAIEQLGRDAVALLDFLKLDAVHFCGLSIGGQTGMWLGVHAPKRLKKLILCNTGAKIGSPEVWNPRIDAVRQGGLKAISGAVIERWFTAGFRAKEPAAISKIQQALESTDPEGYTGCCAAVRDFDCREKLGAVQTPTLVIAGAHDPATPPADGRFVAEKISGARYVELDAAHLSNIEDRDRFTAEVGQFLAA
jgi:3-oxoadipate enol-lactonase